MLYSQFVFMNNPFISNMWTLDSNTKLENYYIIAQRYLFTFDFLRCQSLRIVRMKRSVSTMSFLRLYEMSPCYSPRLTIPQEVPLDKVAKFNGNQTLPGFEPATPQSQHVTTMLPSRRLLVYFHEFKGNFTVRQGSFPKSRRAFSTSQFLIFVHIKLAEQFPKLILSQQLFSKWLPLKIMAVLLNFTQFILWTRASKPLVISVLTKNLW